MAAARRVIGIDPGSIRTGYGVVEGGAGCLRRIDSGVIRAGRGEPVERLVAIHRGLAGLLERLRPDEAAIEEIFVSRNALSALRLGEARGAAVAALGAAGIPIAQYRPSVIKKAVTGNGAAEKFQIQTMVRLLLGLADDPAEDEADALAVAICHLHQPPATEGK